MASTPPERKFDPEAIGTRTVVRLIEETGCVHISPDSPTWRDWVAGDPADRVGELRVYRGRGVVDKVVSAHFRLSSHSVEACLVAVFSRPDSPVPHFVLELSEDGTQARFAVDLLPKRDLGVSPVYVDRCFVPLSQVLSDLGRDARFVPGAVGPRQRALRSPWMASFAHAPSSFEAASRYVDRYFAHWSRLLAGDDPELRDDPAVAERDGLQRQFVFSRERDAPWQLLDRELGVACVDLLLDALR